MSAHFAAALLRATVRGNDQYTSLLCHFDGADAATSSLDYSPNQHTLTLSNGAQLDTAQSKFGPSSALFDGSNDFISIPDHASFDMGSGAFSLECFARFAALPTSTNFQTLISKNWASPNLGFFFGVFNNSGTYQLTWISSADGTTGSADIRRNATLSTGTWYHIAMSRSGSTVKLFLDGTQQGSDGTDSNTIFDAGGFVHLGVSSGGSNVFNGHMDEVRISKGIARWSANFTPPAQPYG